MFLAVVFFALGTILFIAGGFLNMWNPFVGVAIMILGVVSIASAVYFWKKPSGTFR